MIENDEDHKEVAAIFNAELGADLNKNEKESAINELVLKVKLNSLDYRTKNANGDFIDPNTGMIVSKDGPFDIGHKQGES